MKKTALLLISYFTLCAATAQQPCKPNFVLTPSSRINEINWQQFPEFSLPFDICYGGPHFDNKQPFALKRGFSHISEAKFGVPATQFGQLYYLVAYPFQNQPWERLRSPFGNDLQLYTNKWQTDYRNLANALGKPTIEADWFVFDIERQIKANDSILLLRKEPSTPATLANSSDAAFISTYKTALQNLYFQPIDLFKKNGLTASKVSSYGDGPVLNTFTNIQGYTWDEWQKNPTVLNPNSTDLTNTNNTAVGGPFYDAQTILSPSAYYYFDYPSPFAPEYLTYLLFQVEVNRAWSNKPVYPFVWLKYSSNAALENKFIRPWMAEATAIFPFFSGAKGLWLWENPQTFGLDLNYSAYEYFTYGLYRLSEFNEFFTGNYELVIAKSAHELNKTREPVWRGVVKANTILIAAHNPNAKNENEEVVVSVNYKNWSRLIPLKGFEVFLCAFDMSVLGAGNEEKYQLNVFPNPVGESLTIRFNSRTPQTSRVVFFDQSGRKVSEKAVEVEAGNNELSLPTPHQVSGLFYVSIAIDGSTLTAKVVKE